MKKQFESRTYMKLMRGKRLYDYVNEKENLKHLKEWISTHDFIIDELLSLIPNNPPYDIVIRGTLKNGDFLYKALSG